MNCLKNLPAFYKDVINAFHLCKYIQPIEKQNDYDFFSQSIFGNELFRFKDRPLCFKNWLECGFVLVKDLFHEGKWISEDYIVHKLKNKQNWISEYTILKKLIGNIATRFDAQGCLYINTANAFRRRVTIGRTVYDLSLLNK